MSNVKNMYNTEALLKYFIVQVLASATLLFIALIKMLTEDLFTDVPPLPGYRPATSWVHYTTSYEHSLELLKMGEIIARNMLS
jgi:hypothetical protein